MQGVSLNARRVWQSGFAVILLGLSFSATPLQAASPVLSLILPRGVQRGTEAVLDFRGARLDDAEEVFFYRPGVTVTKLERKAANRLLVHVKIAANCRMGEHIAQVRTRTGISEYRTFYVGPFAAVAEKEPNSEFENPQPVSMNVTVEGVVQNEDVDYFAVTVKKGQRISVEVEGMRLGTTLFDPYVAILDSKRFELAAGDDTPLVKQDAVASVIAPADGTYIIEVRESAYGGNGACRYRAHIGSFPRPTAVYPAGGQVGTETEVRFLGDPAGVMVKKVKLPSQHEENFGLLPEDKYGVAPSENPFRLFPYGNILEKEPNDSLAQASPASLPMAFNGIIEKPADVDFFKFSAKKGQRFEVRCYARGVRTGLDPVMNLYNSQGRSMGGNDDSGGPDSFLRFTAPADGDYYVRVTDHLKRGRADFVYRIEFTPIKPSLTLGIPRVARYSQYRQTIYVPRGNRFATLISASRRNFGGELVLEAQGLPQGITMHAEPMASNLSVMPVVFEAAPNAKISGKLVDFKARHIDPKTGIEGRFVNTADMIRGAPGQSIYWRTHVNRLAFAVVDELPFKLEIVEPKAPLVQNGSMQLKIRLHRKPGFNAAVNVQFPFRPPGVSARSSITIPAGKNEGLYPLNASSGAQIKKWKVYALGSANVNGTAWVSSQLANLEIAAPYVQFELARTAVEQGQKTEILCKVNHIRSFDGTAKVRLLGLPNKVTAPELTLTKDVKELVFPITTDKTSPAGRHRNVFCQVVIPFSGEQVVHRRVGGTELRIDKPLPKPTKPKPKPKAKPKTVVKKAPVKKPPMKRLTRLEKLRLEAKKRAEAAAGKK
ncbi:MAG: PPC domain-containing protein [Planctomycetaceae bacterium]